MIYLKKTDGGEALFYRISSPIYVRRQRNGVIVRVESAALAWGVVSPDGTQTWQLAGRESLGEGYTVVEQVTMAEYEEWLALQNQPEEPDPEDTEPVIPEDTDPSTILTRAELTEKVRQLEQELQAAKALLGIDGEQ